MMKNEEDSKKKTNKLSSRIVEDSWNFGDEEEEDMSDDDFKRSVNDLDF